MNSTDRLKHHIFNWLWVRWHMRLRSFFNRFAPPCSSCAETIAETMTMQAYKELAWPTQRKAGSLHCYHAKYVVTSRPWWHMCCNGDAGGWRTDVCDWLEHKWRHYASE